MGWWVTGTTHAQPLSATRRAPSRRAAGFGGSSRAPPNGAWRYTVGVVHDDADEAHADGARTGDVHHVVRGERGIEAVQVGAQALRRQGVEPRAKLVRRHVVLVVAEDHVRHPDRVHALDHAPAGVDARQDARREEVAGEDDEESPRRDARGVVLHHRRQARQVLERVHVVHLDDAQRGARGELGGHLLLDPRAA